MEAIDITSPIDDTVVGTVPAATPADVALAYEKLAASQPAWAARTLAERGKLLKAVAAAMRENVESLSELIVREIAKTPEEARTEVLRTADLIDVTVDTALAMQPEIIPSESMPGTPPGRTQEIVRVPLGVVLAIAPFNYPINLAASKIAPALMLGNTVLFKPPTAGSLTGRAMSELFTRAGIPSDVLVCLTGAARVIGDALLEHEALKMVAMTGSTSVGQQIAAKTGMVSLLLELGGNDPALVLADADIALAAKHIAKGAFQYSGQRCTAVKRVYVDESIRDLFVDALKQEVSSQFPSAGDPREHTVGPVISDAQADFLQELLDDAITAGGRIVHGGKRSGRVFESTVVVDLPHDSRLVIEEQFGPILPIVSVASVEQATEYANDSEYGLQASIFSEDLALARRTAEQIEAGGIHINGPDQRGPDSFLFIGHKKSGFGAQGIRFALEAMSKPKAYITNPR
jgi:glyceraldehyde-3-phosphate dehydrogenase (NADP+)